MGAKQLLLLSHPCSFSCKRLRYYVRQEMRWLFWSYEFCDRLTTTAFNVHCGLSNGQTVLPIRELVDEVELPDLHVQGDRTVDCDGCRLGRVDEVGSSIMRGSEVA